MLSGSLCERDLEPVPLGSQFVHAMPAVMLRSVPPNLKLEYVAGMPFVVQCKLDSDRLLAALTPLSQPSILKEPECVSLREREILVLDQDFFTFLLFSPATQS